MVLHSTCHHTSPVSSGVSCDLFTTFSKYACFWTVEGSYKDPDGARAEHVNKKSQPALLWGDSHNLRHCSILNMDLWIIQEKKYY